MTTTPEVRLRLALDGEGGVHSGLARVATALGDSAQSAERFGQASSAAAAAQAQLAAASTQATAAQKAFSAAGAAATQAVQGQAAIGDAARAAAGGLHTYAQAQAAAGAQTRMTGQQAAQMSAQLQDLFIQIQAGGNPMTALIQQGSQLSAVFGGMRGALSAVATLITPVAVAVTTAAVAVGAVGAAFVSGWRESRAFADALTLTGNAAGITEGQFRSLSDTIGQRTMAGAGEARAALMQVVSSGRLAADAVQTVAGAATAVARATGGDAAEIAKRFVGMTDDIAGAARKLNEQYHHLTAAQYAQIKAAVEAGDTNRAVSLTFGELEARANSTSANLGTLERAWRDLTLGAQGYWEALKQIGRTETTGEQLRALENRISATRAGNFDRAELPGLERQLEVLRKALFLEEERAAASGQRAAQEQAGIKWIEQGAKYLTDQKRLEAEIAAIRRDARAAGKTEDDPEVLQRIQVATDRAKKHTAAVREQGDAYADARAAAQEWARTIERAADIQREAEESTLGLNKAQAELRRFLTSPAYRQATEEARQLALARLYAANAAIEEASAQRAAEAAMKRAAEERETTTRAYERQAAAVEAQVTALDDEETAALRAAHGHETLAQAIQSIAIARLQEQQAIALSIGDDAVAAALEREILAREKLATLIAGKDARIANQKAADDAAREWLRVADQVGQSLADALMEGGRSARDYIKGLFRNLVLQPILRPLTNGIAGFIASASTGGAYAADGGAGGMSLTSLANSYSALSKAYEWYAGSGSGSLSGQMSAYYGEFARSSVGQYFGLSEGAAAAGNNASAYVAPQMTSTGSAIGTAANYAAYAAIGQAIGRSISGGYSALGGQSGSTAVNAGTIAGTVIGSFFGMPQVGAALGAALGGVINRAFGHKAPEVTARGITGSFSGEGFTGEAFTDITRQGGWFRSDKNWTETSAINSDLDKALDAGAEAVRESVAKYTDVLGLPAEQMREVTEQFRIEITDDADANTKAVAEALGKYSTALLGAFQEDVEPFRRSGETLADAIVRLGANLSGVNDMLETLGATALAASLQGADAATELTDLFGGLSGLTSAAGTYYEQYYSQAEKAANMTRALTDVFGDIGVTVPTTRDEFKALVQSQDLMTESGRETFAALMAVAGAFDALQDAGEQLAAQRMELEVELLRAQGDELAAVAIERQAEIDALRALDPALAQVKEMIYAAVDAAKEAEKWRSVWAGVDSVIEDFLGGQDLANYRGGRIKDILAEGGIDSTVEGIIGATKEDILALWNAVGVEGKQAILDAYGAWETLQEALAQSEIDTLLSGLGVSADELLAAYQELNPEADNLVDAWRKTKGEIETLQNALDEFSGTKALTAIEQVRADIAKRTGLESVISGNRDTALNILAGRGTQEGVDALKAREAELWAQYASTQNPEVAAAITRTTLERIRLEGTVAQKAEQALYDAQYQSALEAYELAKATITLEEQAREAQMDALREQIDAAERLKELAENSAVFLGGLRAGTLSNLSYSGRLDAQRGLFESSLVTGENAEQQLTAYLTQAQQMYGGATTAYSAIFESALAQYMAAIGEGASGADQTIATAEAQLNALEKLADQQPELQKAVIDTSQAEIDALMALNSTFGSSVTSLSTSIDAQIKVLQDQLKALEAQKEAQEAAITTYAEGVIAINERLDKLVGSVGAIKTTVETEAARP